MENVLRGMNEKTTGQTEHLKFNTSPLVEVEKVFNAPIGRVWQAWSNPSLVKQWWGPEGFSCPEADIDFREGGEYLFAMQGPDRKIAWSGGIYKEIVPDERIVCTDQFMDEDGNPVSPEVYGLTGEWPPLLYVTIQFESLGENQTRISLVHEGIPAEMHDDCVDGWSSSLDKMQKLVERSGA